MEETPSPGGTRPPPYERLLHPVMGIVTTRAMRNVPTFGSHEKAGPKALGVRRLDAAFPLRFIPQAGIAPKVWAIVQPDEEERKEKGGVEPPHSKGLRPQSIAKSAATAAGVLP